MKVLLAACTLAATSAVVAPAPACAADGARASVHIVSEAGRSLSRCVALGGDVATGLDLLRATGSQVVTEEFAGAGSLVCAIDGRGRAFPAQSCVPPCPTGVCAFWAYFTRDRDTGTWTFSDTGASSRVLRDGDADAWVYGEHRIDGSAFTAQVDEAVCTRGISAAPLPVPVTTERVPVAALAPVGLIVAFGVGAARRGRRRRAP